MNSTKPKKESSEDRRRARRIIVQESFNLFLVIPQVFGMARIYMRDLSKLGLSFRAEIDLGLREGQELQARLYLNPAFFLPVDCRVVRVREEEIGVEFTEPSSPAVKAVAQLQEFFEAAEKAGVLVD